MDETEKVVVRVALELLAVLVVLSLVAMCIISAVVAVMPAIYSLLEVALR